MADTKVHPHPIGVAAGLTAGVVYLICAVVITLWPTQILKFFASWFHGIDLTKLAIPVQLTLGRIILGLISIVLFFYFIGFIYGLLYNLCYIHCKKRKWI